jgi:hypothetical protein
MAEKRMFTKKITHSDEFISMPHSSQNLYFHLNMEADDEGFVNGVKRIMRTINSSDDDLKILIAKRFVLVFESGVIVIKHWKLHNTIRNDRIKCTEHTDEKRQIMEKENGVYTECQPTVNQLSTNCPPSIDKYSIEEISIDKDSTKKRVHKFTPPTLEEVTSYCLERKNNINPQYFIDYQQAREWVLSNGKKMKDWEATIRYWEQNSFNKPQSKVVEIPTYYNQTDDESEKQEALRKLKEQG